MQNGAAQETQIILLDQGLQPFSAWGPGSVKNHKITPGRSALHPSQRSVGASVDVCFGRSPGLQASPGNGGSPPISEVPWLRTETWRASCL